MFVKTVNIIPPANLTIVWYLELKIFDREKSNFCEEFKVNVSILPPDKGKKNNFNDLFKSENDWL